MSNILKKNPKKNLRIITIHEEKRINFSANWTNYGFEDVYLTDESLFQMHRIKLTVWYSKSGKKLTISAPKFPKKVMVRGEISVRGFYPKIVDG